MSRIAAALGRAIGLQQSGRLAEAERLYRRILDGDRRQPDAWHLLGLIAYQRGEAAEAIERIRHAIGLHGGVPAYHVNLGNACAALGRLDEALAAYARALELDPRDAAAHLNRGNALASLERHEEALAAFDQALTARPLLAEAHRGRANALVAIDRAGEALTAYDRSLALTPDAAATHTGRAAALLHLGRHASAEQAARRAVALDPALPEGHLHLGRALEALRRWPEAQAAARAALALRPDFPEAHNNLALALHLDGRLDEAESCYRRALALQPDSAPVHYNLGNLHRDRRRIDSALAAYDRALTLNPAHADAHWNRALTWLWQGDWKRGWPEYEWRWRRREWPPRPFRQPLWDGSPLAGRTILLHAEQGLGDTLQFVRFCPLVRARGAARIIVECQRPLVPLLAHIPADQVVAAGEALPDFDTHLPLLSLPGLTGASPETVPGPCPLSLRPGLLLPPGSRVIRAGLAWSGNPAHPQNEQRSCPVDVLAPLGRIPGVRWFTLHHDPSWPVPPIPLTRHPAIESIEGLAHLIASLDIVVTVDTVMAHLAGTIGTPAWLLLHWQSDWRWGLEGGTTPWYSSMRLFRQPAPEAWEPVVARLAEALAAWRAPKSCQPG